MKGAYFYEKKKSGTKEMHGGSLCTREIDFLNTEDEA